MTDSRPCGRADCPIVDPSSIDRRRLRTIVWPPGTERFRGSRTDHAGAPWVPEGLGDGRFSPLPGRPHAYVAEQRSAAILESVLHEASGPNPRIYAAQLARHSVTRLRFRRLVHLVDLRDPALADLGIEPTELTDALPLHYACTRQVAERLIGSKGTHGFVWTSRQGRLHRERNPDGLAAEVLEHRRLDAAVIYQDRYDGTAEVLGAEPLTADGDPTRYVLELASLLRIAIL